MSNSTRTNRNFTVPATKHTYAYIHHPRPPGSDKPTLLFLHGFPSTSYEWRGQVAFFVARGYGVLVPDLLGSGGSSKPTDVKQYIGRTMAADIVAILQHEGLAISSNSSGEKMEGGSERKRETGGVVGIAHDWGTYLLSQLAVWYGDVCEKYVFMSVPHTLPGRKTDLVRFNKMMKEEVGYEVYGYQFFLAESRRAGGVLGGNWESFFNLIYPRDPELWKTHMAPTGALEAFLKIHTPSSSAQFSASWVTIEDRARHYESFGDDYESCLKWYERSINSLGVEEEKEDMEKSEGKIGNGGRIVKETLMVAGLRDAVCGAERARGVMGRVVERGMLKVVDLDCGHWIMHEKRDETNEVLEEFFEFGVGVGEMGRKKGSKL